MLANLRLRRWSQNVLSRTLVYFLIFCMNLSYAAPAANSPHPSETQTEETAVSNTGPLTLNSSDLGLAGPLAIGMGYGSLDNFSVNAQYTKKFNSSFAGSLLGEYGPEMYRFGATLGARFFENSFGKISAEQFTQNLPFDFDSGAIDKFVKQNAYGARYQQTFDIPLLQNINGGIYYANAPNISLDPIYYEVNGLQAINYRNIAGGTSTGGDVGTEFHLSPSTEFTASLYYDHLRYDTEFTEHSDDDAQGLGGGLGLRQLLGDKFAISAVGSVREIYNTYTAGLSWLPSKWKGSEISLLGQSIVSHNDTPNNESIGLQLGYNFGAGGIGARYALSSLTTTKDVGQWTNTPAVYMEQVLAVSEQYSVFVDPTKSAAAAQTLNTPTITAINPVSGPLKGTENIVITGENFVEPIKVTFDGVKATQVKVNNQNEIVVNAPRHKPGKVAVQITSDLGASAITETTQYTYQLAPKITKISHTEGPAEGGTVMTITGKNFTGATKVKFGEIEGVDLIVVSPTQVTVKSPAQADGTEAFVNVATPSGISKNSKLNTFTYNATTVNAVPVLEDALASSSGTTQLLKFFGSNLGGVTNFYINGVNTPFTIHSNHLTANISPNVAGTVLSIQAKNASGLSNLATLTYFAPAVFEVNPHTSPLEGGATMTVQGGYYIGATTVMFGTNPVSISPSSINAAGTEIKVTIPPTTTPGPVTINVCNANDCSVAFIDPRTTLTYSGTPPDISLSSYHGTTAGGVKVTITGTDFNNATSVTFDGISASFTVKNNTTIEATTPSHVQATVPVVVNYGVLPSNPVTYFFENPQVVQLSLTEGPTAGGEMITIKGNYFHGATSVTFDGTPGTDLHVVSDTEIKITNPPHPGGLADVIVVNPISSSSPTIQFDYLVPMITSLSLTDGATAGGQEVTITGTNFLGATGVKFDVTLGTQFNVVNDTTIKVKTPSHFASTVAVSVVNPEGSYSSGPPFTYHDPLVSTLSITNGATGGGQDITITGQYFEGSFEVLFGATAVPVTPNAAGTTIHLKTPGHSAGTVNVIVKNPVSQSTGTPQFTYHIPIITSFTPNKGSDQGGTTVTFEGNYFSGVTSVDIGSPVHSFTVHSNNKITAVTSAHALGFVTPQVGSIFGTGVAGTQYEYTNAPPPPPPPVNVSTTTTHRLHSTSGVNSLASAAMNAATPKVLDEILPIIYLELKPANETIKVSQSVQPHVSVANENESTVAFKSSDVTWQSSDPKVASVDEFGKITGQAPGVATIVASAHGISRGIMINVK